MSAKEEIEQRMRDCGIELSYYIDQVIKGPWGRPAPIGFQFSVRRIDQFFAALLKNDHFGRAAAIFDVIRNDGAFREVGAPDSLHIIFTKGRSECEVHLDTVSIADKRDSRTGQVIYVDDIGVMMKHVVVDKEHKKWPW